MTEEDLEDSFNIFGSKRPLHQQYKSNNKIPRGPVVTLSSREPYGSEDEDAAGYELRQLDEGEASYESGQSDEDSADY
jgi:hypothetical protein